MAVVKIPSDNVTLTDALDVTTFLAVRGIEYERWTPNGEVPADAPAEAVLEAYAHQIQALKRRGGYVTADVIDVNADTPNLDVMLAKFNKEHWHDEDEVRFIIEGRGPLPHQRRRQRLRAGSGRRRPDSRAARHAPLVRPLRREADPGHSPVPESFGLDAALHRERRRPRLPAALLRAGLRRVHQVPRAPGAAALVVAAALNLTTAGIDFVLLDIEGTTTPIAFVHDVLFPYARARVRAYLEETAASDPETASDRRGPAVRASSFRLPASRRKLRQLDEPAAGSWKLDIASYVYWLMDRDRKSGPLKALQGRIWEEGYATGALTGEVYPDVRDAFVRWTSSGRRIGIFSSGSVLAQRLLFGRSTAGDLSTFLSGYFDTAVGAKGEADSYRRIVAALAVHAGTHVVRVGRRQRARCRPRRRPADAAVRAAAGAGAGSERPRRRGVLRRHRGVTR